MALITIIIPIPIYSITIILKSKRKQFVHRFSDNTRNTENTHSYINSFIIYSYVPARRSFQQPEVSQDEHTANTHNDNEEQINTDKN